MPSSSAAPSSTRPRIGSAVWQTIAAPQWGMLLVIVTLGILANTGAGVLVALIGLLISLALCLLGMGALGFDGNISVSGLLKFVFSFNQKISTPQLALGALLLVIAVGTTWITAKVTDLSAWLIVRVPSPLAPHPDEDLAVVFIVCGVFTVASIVLVLVHKRWIHNLENTHLPTMNRAERRAEGISKEHYDKYTNTLAEASKRTAYWTEASLLLGLATVALLPGALGWIWLWGVVLSIVLPMFVLSVRFRLK